MLQQKDLFQENGFVLSFKTSFILPVMLLSTPDNYFFPSAAVMLGLTVFLLSRVYYASLEFHGFRLLRESLSDEQKELLDKLIESVTDISSISERDMFINGFRLGIKLMIDVMQDE